MPALQLQLAQLESLEGFLNLIKIYFTLLVVYECGLESIAAELIDLAFVDANLVSHVAEIVVLIAYIRSVESR